MFKYEKNSDISQKSWKENSEFTFWKFYMTNNKFFFGLLKIINFLKNWKFLQKKIESLGGSQKCGHFLNHSIKNNIV